MKSLISVLISLCSRMLSGPRSADIIFTKLISNSELIWDEIPQPAALVQAVRLLVVKGATKGKIRSSDMTKVKKVRNIRIVKSIKTGTETEKIRKNTEVEKEIAMITRSTKEGSVGLSGIQETDIKENILVLNRLIERKSRHEITRTLNRNKPQPSARNRRNNQFKFDSPPREVKIMEETKKNMMANLPMLDQMISSRKS